MRDGEKRPDPRGEDIPEEPPSTEAPLFDAGALETLAEFCGEDVDPAVELGEASRYEAETVADPGATRAAGDARAESSQPGASGVRYDVTEEIARGGMGAIFRVRDRDLRRSLAMKIAHGGSSGGTKPATAISREHLSRFLEEAQITAQLAHPGVVPVHELGVDADGRVFFTMTLVRGSTYSEVVRKARAGVDAWTSTRALQILQRVCETVAFAHDKGVIHRDLKPDNVMVGRFGETYVMDWGLAKVLGRDDGRDVRPRTEDSTGISLVDSRRAPGGDDPLLTMDGAVLGTPAYMPPEQARGHIDDVDQRSDVYAIGAMLYELLTGLPPYVDGETRTSPHELLRAVIAGPPRRVSELAPEAPEELQSVCDKAMARDREQRYQSVEELASDLQRFLTGRVVRAHRSGALIEMRKWIERNRAVAATAAVAATLLAVGTIAYVVHMDMLSDETAAALVRTRALALASEARAVAATRPDLAGLLAREALQLDRSPELATRLHEVIRDAPCVVATSIGGPSDRAKAYSVQISEDGSFVVASGRLDGEEPRRDVVRAWRRDGTPLATFWEPSSTTFWSELSPNGRHVAACSRDGTALIADLETRHVVRLERHTERVVTSRFSSNGTRVVTASADGTAIVWSLDGEELHTLAGHTDELLDARFSPDGERIVTASTDGTAAVWDAESGERTAKLEHGSPLRTAWPIPDGDTVLTCGSDGSYVWWGSDGEPRGRFRTDSVGHYGIDVVAHPDGRHVLVSSGGPMPELRTLDGAVVARFPHDALEIREIALSADGRWVACGTNEGDVVVWHVDGRRLRKLVGHEAWITDLDFTPDGASLASTDIMGNVRVWELENGGLARVSGAWAWLPSPDGSRLHIRTESRFTVVTRGGRELFSAPGEWRHLAVQPRGGVGRAAASDDEDRVVVWDADGTERAVLDLGHLRRRVDNPGGSYSPFGLDSLALSPDGSLLATGHTGGTIRVWRMDGSLVSEQQVVEDEDFPALLERLAFLSNGRSLINSMTSDVVAVDSSAPYEWDGATRWVLAPSLDRAAVFGPGDMVQVEERPNEFRLVDASTTVVDIMGTVVGRTEPLPSDIQLRAFSDGGRWLTVSDLDGNCALWDSQTATSTMLTRGGAPVAGAVLREDVGILTTATRDVHVQRWTTEGVPVDDLKLRVAGVQWFDEAIRTGTNTVSRRQGRVEVLPDGERVLTWSDDRELRTWVTSWTALEELVESRVVRPFTTAELFEFADLLDRDPPPAMTEEECNRAARDVAVDLTSTREALETALLHAETACAQAPEEAIFQFTRALVLCRLERADEAAAALDLALECAPHSRRTITRPWIDVVRAIAVSASDVDAGEPLVRRARREAGPLPPDSELGALLDYAESRILAR